MGVLVMVTVGVFVFVRDAITPGGKVGAGLADGSEVRVELGAFVGLG